MPASTFTTDEDAYVVAHRGHKTAEAIGHHLGRSADAIRRRWRVLGLTAKKPPTAAQRRAQSATTAPGLSDADLIALHLAHRGVTSCPPGIAAGIAPLERHTGFTAQPQQTLSYREKGNQLVRASIARRQASA